MHTTESSSLEYLSTNESLPSIILGLDPKSSDHILAVGGSGDQAFALLEHAASVVVTDTNPSQINYIRLRAECLRSGNINGFLEGPTDPDDPLLQIKLQSIFKRNTYFSQGNRLKRISANIQGLEICEPGDYLDIVHVLNPKRFNKFYLSNILGRGHTYSIKEKRGLKFIDLYNSSRDESLFYLSIAGPLKRMVPEISIVSDLTHTSLAKDAEYLWTKVLVLTKLPGIQLECSPDIRIKHNSMA